MACSLSALFRDPFPARKRATHVERPLRPDEVDAIECSWHPSAFDSLALKRFRLSQAAVTRSMRPLEEEAAMPLLLRKARGIGLTPTGKKLLAAGARDPASSEPGA